MLAQAQDFYKTKDHIPCLDRCEILMAMGYGVCPRRAFQLGRHHQETIPNGCKAACDHDERPARENVDRARPKGCSVKDSPTEPVIYFDRAIRAFPATSLAESAQIRLSQLNGIPVRPPKPTPPTIGPDLRAATIRERCLTVAARLDSTTAQVAERARGFSCLSMGDARNGS